MRKEIPWTLEGKGAKKRHTISDSNRKINNNKNTSELVINLLKGNKDKFFTALDISNKINRSKPTTTIVLNQLINSGKIKIVGFEKENNLAPLYQCINGNLPKTKYIDLSKNKEFISIPNFINKNNVTNSVGFRYFINESNLLCNIAKTDSSFCYAYKEKELERLLETYNKEKEHKEKVTIKGENTEEESINISKNSSIKVIQEFFETHKSKTFTCYEICDLIGRGKKVVSAAIEYLEGQGILVITDFRQSNTLVPLYQYKTAKTKEIRVLNYETEGVPAGLITLRGFEARNIGIDDIKFRYLVSKNRVPSVVVKIWNNFYYAYKEEDLKKILDQYFNHDTTKGKRTRIPLKFKIFGLTITVSK